jgi:outer membrane protein OmpA-like peptidoglycan-associated protein
MKIRVFALAGAAALALAGPASANDTQGWYLGLGAGWDEMQPVHFVTAPPLSATGAFHQSDSAIVAGSFGYKWADNLRLEVELGYDSHSEGGHTPPFVATVSGRNQLKSGLANLIYDWNLGSRWSLSLGAGAGVGQLDMSLKDSLFPGLKLISDQHAGFMWQGIVGLNYEVNPDVELFVDYRYRSASIDQGYTSSFASIRPVHIDKAQENVVMVGIRWYPDVTPPPPPPMAPPPPPPMPMPTKTFVVFFDFNKSNLTAEAQSVVGEAVKTAKSSGMVRVLVTGHTDTVGSDSYNMGLSVRRAQSVKDEMVREGIDGSGVSIEGKGFHDPLVPTGPGVREPQNRRAVIDLGH